MARRSGICSLVVPVVELRAAFGGNVVPDQHRCLAEQRRCRSRVIRGADRRRGRGGGRMHRTAHRPLNAGSRFSKNAATPSCRSSLSKMRCCATVERVNAASRGPSWAASTSSFARRFDNGPRDAIVAASSRAACERRSVTDPVDEAPAQRDLGGDRFAGEEQFLGARRPHESCKAQRTVAGETGETRFGQAEHHALARHPQIAGQRKLEAASERGGVDRRNRRHRQAREPAEDHVLEKDLVFTRIRVQVREFAHVAARAERARVLPMHDHAAHIVCSLEGRQHAIERAQKRARDQVQRAGRQRDFRSRHPRASVRRGENRHGSWCDHPSSWRRRCAGPAPCSTPMRSNWR